MPTRTEPKLHSRSARIALPLRPEPHWVRLTTNQHLGYRRNLSGSGTWIVRLHRDGRRTEHRLGTADDDKAEPGTMTFDEARQAAIDWCGNAGTPGKAPYTVARCIGDYIAWAEEHRKSAAHMRTYAEAYVLPRLGALDAARLTAQDIRDWHASLAAEPPRRRAPKGAPPAHGPEQEDAAEARNMKTRPRPAAAVGSAPTASSSSSRQP